MSQQQKNSASVPEVAGQSARGSQGAGSPPLPINSEAEDSSRSPGLVMRQAGETTIGLFDSIGCRIPAVDLVTSWCRRARDDSSCVG